MGFLFYPIYCEKCTIFKYLTDLQLCNRCLQKRDRLTTGSLNFGRLFRKVA